jgi:hypothetical protein
VLRWRTAHIPAVLSTRQTGPLHSYEIKATPSEFTKFDSEVPTCPYSRRFLTELTTAIAMSWQKKRWYKPGPELELTEVATCSYSVVQLRVGTRRSDTIIRRFDYKYSSFSRRDRFLRIKTFSLFDPVLLPDALETCKDH